MNKDKILQDIVDKVIQYNLAPRSSRKEIEEWYNYALDMDIVEYEYDENGELLGFLDWVNLPRIPVSLDDAREMFYNEAGGDVGMVLCTYVRSNKDCRILNRLKKKAEDKNNHVKVKCYHNKKKDKIMVFNVANNGGKLCEEIVAY